VSADATTNPRPRLWRLAAALVLGALVAALALLSAARPTSGAAAAGPKPNVVVLLTDDQEPSSMRVMNTVKRQMKAKGVTMQRFYMNFPLCCPSRTTLLTGQYAHNHGVLSNQAPTGGYGTFNDLHGNDYLPIWLQAAGYRTSYIGKFLNEYAEPDEYGTLPTDVPKGWDDWHVFAPSKAEYFNYTLNQNGTLAQFGQGPKSYSTDVLTTKARHFIRSSLGAAKPFFLMLGYAAPHGGGGGDPGRSCNRGAVPAPRHLGDLRKRRKFDLPPSFNEADVSDKPSPVSQLSYMAPNQISDVTRKRRCAWESLLSVDDSVGSIIETLEKAHALRNTYVFYLSDNGYLRGEHRIRNQKRYLYEESIRVPFVVRGPGIPRGEKSEDVVTNADLVPTIAQLTGANPDITQDGQSLLTSLRHPNIERGRAILLEAYAGQTILGVRTSRYLYTEWDTGISLLPERELYDTYVDPYELNNLAALPEYQSIVSDLGQQLDELIDCAGQNCHTAPSATLTVSGSPGPKNCQLEPVVARVESPSADEIVSVSVKANGVAAGEDTVAPYELPVPYGALRDALPKPGKVVAKVLFKDGRRIALVDQALACA
jgi:arylsulfatase A-like enzyme